MQKTLKTILCLTLAMLLMICLAACGEEKPAGLAGDVDGSGSVNYQDALMILRYTIGLQTLEREDLADFDGNGKADYNDALKILRASIGLK
jgi:hypothetical protein